MSFLKEEKHHDTKLSLQITEIVLNVYFTAEYIIRFTLCPKKKVFLRSRLNTADWLSLIPIYVDIAFCQYPEYDKYKNYVNILVIFRVLKVFRSFRYNYTLQVLVNTLKESLPELSLLVFLMMLLATVFAYACYFTERDDPNTAFHSVPHSLWWAFITMTTVSIFSSFLFLPYLALISVRVCTVFVLRILTYSFTSPYRLFFVKKR